MRSPGWTPSIVPDVGDHDFDLVRLRHSHHTIHDATSLVEHREFVRTRMLHMKRVGKVRDGLADSCPACD
jgi:hypothetical protein